jgi:hypothetical protein
MAVLTAGLENLRRQLDAWAPSRDHTSDGTIGDKAHQAETSGHNPDDTPGSRPEWDNDPDHTAEIRALDIDTDFRNGVPAQVLVDHIRALPGLALVIRYMIYNRKMYHERNGFRPTPYTGASAHTEHIHFDGAWTQTADNNRTFNFHLEEIPVALTADDKRWLTTLVDGAAASAALVAAEKVWSAKIGNENHPTRTARQALNDLSNERDALVDPMVTLEEAGVVEHAPLARIIAAADKTIDG